MANELKIKRFKPKDVRIDEILAASRTVFFKKGYFNATIDEIAKLAGISKGTVYLYFKNKDELYASLILPMIEEYKRLLLELENNLINNKFKTGHDLIMEFCKVFSNLYEYDPEGLRIYQVYLSTDLFLSMPQRTKDRLWLTGKRNIGIMKTIISGATKVGLLPEINTRKIVNVMWATFLGVFQWEDSKHRISNNNNLIDTLEYSFSLISKGLGLNKDFG